MRIDPTTYPWEGIAAHGNTPFSTTLICHIEGNLWMGGCIDGLDLPEDFSYELSLYPWERYNIGDSTTRVEVEMYDAAMADDHFVKGIAALGSVMVRNGKTLINCQAGLNRSGLISALVLMEVTGRSANEAIYLLRKQRTDGVLCNPYFVAWLLNQ